jgi:serine/threonine protein kinase
VVAIKVYGIPISSVDENQEVKSMRQEVSMLKNYKHPLVIKYIDSFIDMYEKAYLVCELAEKFDLRKEMNARFIEKKFFSEIEAQNIIL